MNKIRPAGTLFANVRYKFAIYFSIVNFALVIVAFASPYWLQRWPRIHTPFVRLGLWEFCLAGFTARLDTKMVSHFDCWWIFSPYLEPIFTNLVPWWFIIIQVLMSIAVFVQCLMHFCFIFYWCYPISNIERRLRFIKFGAISHGITLVCLLISVIIFGVEHKNPNWMPYPTLNWASWSYGIVVLATFLSLFVFLAFESTWRESKRTLETAGQNFPLTTILRKSEKAKIVEQQAKLANKARLEPVMGAGEQPSDSQGISREMQSEEASYLSSSGSAVVRRRDPRFGTAGDDL